MPKPKDVNPQNFQVESVLFDNGDFSIVFGQWEDNAFRNAMERGR